MLDVFADPLHVLAFAKFRRLPAAALSEWVDLLHNLATQSSSDDGPIILDVGCGSGRFAIPLCQSGCRVIGMDLSQAMIDAATNMSLSEQVTSFVGLTSSFEAYVTPVRFDLILFSEMLHLVGDKQGVITKAKSLLVEGGHLAIRAPSHDQLRGHEYYRYFDGALDIDLSRHTDVDDYEQMLVRSGFTSIHRRTIDESEYIDSIEYLHALENRYLSTLYLIGDVAFREGIEKVKVSLKGAVLRRMTMTLIQGQYIGAS